MPTDFIQANTNGRLHDAREPSLPPLNRGFLYGDAIYEVWRTYEGILFAWDEHWQRLEHSAAALHIGLPSDAATMWGEVSRTAAAYRQTTGYAGELYVRLQITRGGGPIGLDVALADQPDFVLLVQANKGLPPAKLQHGYALSLETNLRRNPPSSLNPAWKTGNYLNNILCLREARSRGADEVLMVNLAGEATESAVANIGFVQRGDVITPPLSAGILGGITRDLVLHRIAAAAGLRMTERVVTPAELGSMEECFLMSTTRDISPVGSIDGHRFAVGPGSVTRRLKAAFADYVRDYGARHPQQRLA
ncbi:MAG: aminotransferase class IV [Opitutales bacterium]